MLKFDPSVVFTNWDLLAWGLFVTLKYTLYTCTIGLTIGLFVALLQLTPWRMLRWTGRIWVEFFRNIPLLVLLGPLAASAAASPTTSSNKG